jgi:hypothetical protein
MKPPVEDEENDDVKDARNRNVVKVVVVTCCWLLRLSAPPLAIPPISNNNMMRIFAFCFLPLMLPIGGISSTSRIRPASQCEAVFGWMRAAMTVHHHDDVFHHHRASTLCKLLRVQNLNFFFFARHFSKIQKHHQC